MRNKEVQHCERTGRLIGHCGCGDCYARRLAQLVREDRTLRSVNRTPASAPRYLVTNAL
ncbi:MAG: hypothetical protein ACR2OC_01825 [Solirubrobacterales bacterium]